MPPQRTVPPTKAIKTERTHEENQERAYIAASRRSDRSLEARVESARRASEIHKRRTGRSLRVTEQDVVNEEMYEEEDDDLPMQYRRLTAHLQTGSADFNRRLAAYLTNHVAMRSALDQAITHSYAQQYPNAPQFPHNQQTVFPSPMMPPNFMQQPQEPSPLPQQQISHQKPHQQTQPSPHPYRQSPYQTPGTPGYRKPPHIRSMSSSTPHEIPGFVQSFSDKSPIEGDPNSGSRRMSMPASTVASADVSTSSSAHSNSPPNHSKVIQSPSSQPMPPPSVLPYSNSMYQDLNPLSTSLPRETQMMLGQMFDINDPLGSMPMTGSQNVPQPFYNFNGQMGMSKFNTSFDGMNATLAPSMLDISPDNSNSADLSSATADSSAMPLYHYGFDNIGDYKGLSFVSQNSGQGSGSVTPGNDGGWDAFINDNSWAENAT